MGPRTYDFSNYQGGFEALVGSALQGGGDAFQAVQKFRQGRKAEAQGDEERTLRMQILKDQQDEVARSHGLSRGGASTAGPTGGTYGNSGFRTPDFNPNVGGPASAAAGALAGASGAFGGVIPGEHAPANGPQAATPDASTDTQPSLARRVGGMLGGAFGRVKDNMTTGGFRPFEAQPSYVKTGPSDAEALAGTEHGYRMGEQGAANDAAMGRLGVTEGGLNARNDADNRARLREAEIRASAEGRGQRSQILLGLNASVDDRRARLQQLQRVIQEPLESSIFAGLSQPEIQARKRAAMQEAATYEPEVLAAQDDRDEYLAGLRGVPFQRHGAPDTSVRDALANLDAQRQAKLQRVTDPAGRADVERVYQQERAKLLGRSLMAPQAAQGPGISVPPTQGAGGLSLFGH